MVEKFVKMDRNRKRSESEISGGYVESVREKLSEVSQYRKGSAAKGKELFIKNY